MAQKTAIYIRVSTQTQHIDRQEEELKAFADKNSHHVVDIYKDMLSGFKDEEHRPALKRLIEDCKLKKIDTVLFSEFSRLSRKIGDLNNMIEIFRKYNTELYFHKQDLWVRKTNDFSTNILLQVLAVVSEYEIELFKERSISGKISAVKNRGINLGGLTAFGYKSEAGTKQLIPDTDESPIVKRIFELYASGKTAQFICDVFNAEGIPSPYSKRLQESKLRRKEKGFEEKEYKKLDPEKLVWIGSSLTKILKNPLYTGKRNIKVRNKKLDDSNNNDYQLIEIENNESIRIIDDKLFQKVQNKLKENNLVKNTPTKHPTLLKSVLKCGSCGRNIMSTKANGSYRYMCFGKLKDSKTRHMNCTDSLEIAQYKLDGLVVQLIIFRLADADRSKKSSKRIHELTLEKDEQEKIHSKKHCDLDTEKNNWYKYFDQATRNDIPENIILNRKNEYDTKANKLKKEIDKLKNDITTIEKTIRSIESMSKSTTQNQEETTIRENKELLKQLTDEYLDKVTIYPIFDKYSLVIVSFKDGSETWGTIKSAKYKKDETWFDPTYCKEPHYKYQLWDNDDKSAQYIPENKTVIYKGKTATTTWINEGASKSKTKFEFIGNEGKKNPTLRRIKQDINTDDSNYVETTLSEAYITIEPGTYTIKEFINLLKDNNSEGNNSNGNFPPYDFHEDEKGHEENKAKALRYRIENADKRNKRTKELRNIKKTGLSKLKEN
jgi:site-specific DNA recombinase